MAQCQQIAPSALQQGQCSPVTIATMVSPSPPDTLIGAACPPAASPVRVASMLLFAACSHCLSCGACVSKRSNSSYFLVHPRAAPASALRAAHVTGLLHAPFASSACAACLAQRFTIHSAVACLALHCVQVALSAACCAQLKHVASKRISAGSIGVFWLVTGSTAYCSNVKWLVPDSARPYVLRHFSHGNGGQ